MILEILYAEAAQEQPNNFEELKSNNKTDLILEERDLSDNTSTHFLRIAPLPNQNL